MKMAYVGVLLLMSLGIDLAGQAQKPKKKKIASRYPAVMVKAPTKKVVEKGTKSRVVSHRKQVKKTTPVNARTIEENKMQAWRMMQDRRVLSKIEQALQNYTSKSANYATKANAVMNLHRLYDQLNTKEYKAKAETALKKHKITIEKIKKESHESKALTHFGHLMHAHERQSGSRKPSQSTAQKLMKNYDQLNAERRALADKHLQMSGLSAKELRQMATVVAAEPKKALPKTPIKPKPVATKKLQAKK